MEVVYAELPTKEQAEEILLEISFPRGYCYLSPFAQTCQPDPNPKVLKITVQNLDPKNIDFLAKKYGITRITRNYQQIWPRQASVATTAAT